MEHSAVRRKRNQWRWQISWSWFMVTFHWHPFNSIQRTHNSVYGGDGKMFISRRKTRWGCAEVNFPWVANLREHPCDHHSDKIPFTSSSILLPALSFETGMADSSNQILGSDYSICSHGTSQTCISTVSTNI
jgi:hypothetical protein